MADFIVMAQLNVTIADSAEVPLEQRVTFIRERLTDALSKIPARHRMTVVVADIPEVQTVQEVDMDE